ncbi:MAG: vWA domain-containing protein [Vulcanimicrobiaceae bacterium]
MSRRDLLGGVLEFCTLLRREHGFSLGHAEASDALRALETVGVTDRPRARAALRLVCCSKAEEIPPFERAFDAFFLEPRGKRQPPNAARHTRPEARPATAPPKRRRVEDDESAETSVAAWQRLRARYSPAPGSGEPPPIPQEGLAEMLAAVDRLLASLRLGRTRRWKPLPRGPRFDLRRTLRASLHTGGDPVVLHRLGHPHRNPRLVLLLDGSRSMAPHAPRMLQFAYALAVRSPRASVFLFSTDLREVTRDLRALAKRAEPRLYDLGATWGGGTRIGANLAAFVRAFGSCRLTEDTVTVIYSDGLDAGEIPQLESALRDIRKRSAALVWLNPHAATPGFAPAARGMQAALPHLALLTTLDALTAQPHSLHLR